MLLGDTVNVAESFHRGIHDRPEAYPKVFDIVHLSNIPDKLHFSSQIFTFSDLIIDYIGSSLTMSIILAKIVSPEPGNFMKAICLQNTGLWKDMSTYHREYSLLSDPSDLNKVFQIQHLKGSKDDTSHAADLFFSIMPEFQGLSGISGPFGEGRYQCWPRSSNSSHQFSQLLPRESPKIWLFALFFKLCVPATQRKAPYHSIILARESKHVLPSSHTSS